MDNIKTICPIICPICKSDCTYKKIVAKDFNRAVSSELFDYFCCNSCSTIFLDQIPKNLGTYYAGAYPAYDRPDISELEIRADQEQSKIDLVVRYAHGKTLLEIGPSYGAFLYLATKQGFRAEAIEMDPDCCAYIRKNVGVPVHQTSNVTDCLAGLGTFDVITLWHVMEHLQDPVGLLHRIVEHLNPGGVLVVAAPNPKALEFALFGRYWVHLDAPRHLRFVPLKTLTNLLHGVGMSVVYNTSCGRGESPYNNCWWFLQSLNSMIDNCNYKNIVSTFYSKCRFVYKLIYFVIIKPLVLFCRNSNSYTVVFRKDG